jgi:hypothetical protein
MLRDATVSKGQVAQSVEQRTENPCVGGSIPPLATNKLRSYKLTLITPFFLFRKLTRL